MNVELERQLFERGKEVLGKTSGGLIARLLKAKEGNLALARATIEYASTKQDPREWVAKQCGHVRHVSTDAVDNGLVYVQFADRDAWDDYGRRINTTYPRDSKGGWWFPTRQPPT